MAPLAAHLAQVEACLRLVGDSSTAEHWQQFCQWLNDPQLHMVVFGQFGCGKSTLINALLGRKVLPAKMVPTTGHITRIIYGTREEVRVTRVNGSVETCDLAQLGGCSALSLDGTAREDVASIDVAINSPLTRDGLILVDTPGRTDSEAQPRRAMAAIARGDLVLLLLDARQLLTGDERSLAVELLGKKLGKPVALVVNFINFLDEGERNDMRRRLEQWCGLTGRPVLGATWFEVDALGNLQHVLGVKPAPVDGFYGLKRAVAECRDGRRHRLQERSRRGQLLAETRRLERENQEIMDRLRADADKVARDRWARCTELELRRARLSALAAAQREQITIKAQKILDRELALLTGVWFARETRSSLARHALQWYEERLAAAITAVEEEALRDLIELAGADLRPPERLTIAERMVLAARLEVAHLPNVAASRVAVGGAAGRGGAIGTLLLPSMGTLFGAALGSLLGVWIDSSEIDYVAAYSVMAHEQWPKDANRVLELCRAQYDARVAALGREIDEQLAQVNGPLAGPAELATRQALAQALEATRRVLESRERSSKW